VAVDMDLLKGDLLAEDGNGCFVVGKTGGIPGRVGAAEVVEVVVVVVDEDDPGVTAAAASLTKPIIPPNSPPAA